VVGGVIFRTVFGMPAKSLRFEAERLEIILTMKIMTRGRWLPVIGSCLLLGLLSSCATAPQASKTYTFFPPAPDDPHIQFLTSFSGDLDLGRSWSFGEYISGIKPAGPLVKPYGLALHGGKIFICDTVQGVVEVFDLKKRRASYFAPQGEGRMMMPVNISIDDDGTRYVADSLRNQVLVYGPDGAYLTAIGKKDEFKPTDVAVTTDRLYITDLQAHAVKVYGKADRKLLFSIPVTTNATQGKLFSPANLTLDKVNNHLLVSDMGGFAVQTYDLDGKYLNTIGQQGVGMGCFSLPKGVAVDREGITYVVDSRVQVVQMFDKQGRLLMYFGQPGASTHGELLLPASVKVDYDHVGYFEKYVAPGHRCEYLILVTSQFGHDLVSVYGFLK
jgi:DNA-binding beta-propeller fold protein YncE